MDKDYYDIIAGVFVLFGLATLNSYFITGFILILGGIIIYKTNNL